MLKLLHKNQKVSYSRTKIWTLFLILSCSILEIMVKVFGFYDSFFLSATQKPILFSSQVSCEGEINKEKNKFPPLSKK